MPSRIPYATNLLERPMTRIDTEKTDQELWEEVLRTADLLRRNESGMMDSMTSLMEQASEEDSISEDDLPTDYVSDAQILTKLLSVLEERGAKFK